MDKHLTNTQPQIAKLCQAYGVLRLDVFGSAASDAQLSPPNDYDFIVELGEQQGLSKARRWINFAQALESVLGKPVDLVSPQALRNPYLIQQIEANHHALYAQPRPQTAV